MKRSLLHSHSVRFPIMIVGGIGAGFLLGQGHTISGGVIAVALFAFVLAPLFVKD